MTQFLNQCVLFSPKDSQYLKTLDIRLREVGAKRRLNGTSKVNRRTDKQTDRQTDRQTNIWTFRLIDQRADALKIQAKYFLEPGWMKID